jgi:hypothetical protein
MSFLLCLCVCGHPGLAVLPPRHGRVCGGHCPPSAWLAFLVPFGISPTALLTGAQSAHHPPDLSLKYCMPVCSGMVGVGMRWLAETLLRTHGAHWPHKSSEKSCHRPGSLSCCITFRSDLGSPLCLRVCGPTTQTEEKLPVGLSPGMFWCLVTRAGQSPGCLGRALAGVGGVSQTSGWGPDPLPTSPACL